MASEVNKHVKKNGFWCKLNAKVIAQEEEKKRERQEEKDAQWQQECVLENRTKRKRLQIALDIEQEAAVKVAKEKARADTLLAIEESFERRKQEDARMEIQRARVESEKADALRRVKNARRVKEL